MEGLLTAVKALQIAPVETAKAVQVTVEGTASMVGQAFQSCTETVTAATQESMQQLAESTRNAKVLCMHCMSDDSVTSASSFTHDSLKMHPTHRAESPVGQVVRETRANWEKATADLPKVSILAIVYF
jgi:hypothetical protein